MSGRRPFDKDYPSLLAPIGARTCWELRVPAAGWLQRLYIQQIAGTNVASFTVKVFRSHKPCEQSSMSVGDNDPAVASLSPEAYQVGSTLTATGHLLDQVWSPPLQYRNADGSPAVPIHKLYIEIDPVGAPEDAAWDLSVGGYTEAVG